MKQIRNILVWIILFSTSSIFFLSAFAQSYRTDFNVFKEKNWELWGEHSIWNAEKGYLKGRIQVPHNRTEMLQFKGLPGTYLNIDISVHREIIQRQIKKPGYENFTITLKDLGARQGDFGIALGKLLDYPPDAYPFFYVFFTNSIRAVRFNGWRRPTSFAQWHVPRHPATRWVTLELESMELHFNSGHFQWFANGEKRADFRDPEFSSIEIIGVALAGHEFCVCSGWAGSFTLTGLGLSVSPQAKLATTWGQFKQLR